MLRSITWRQFAEWIAYSSIEPFEEQRGDLRDAHIVSTVSNMFSKHPRPMKEFLLRYDSHAHAPDPPITDHEQSMRHKAVMWQWVTSLGLNPIKSDHSE